MNKRMNSQTAPQYTDAESLLRRIQAIGFAKNEAALYLDAHPDCRGALDYYKKLADEYILLTEQYENKYGALLADNTAPERWSWVDGSWPWQLKEV